MHAAAIEHASRPRTVHGVNVSVDTLHRDGWRLRLGVAGIRTDGESDQAVDARVQMRF